MKQISLIILCMVNSFNVAAAMHRGHKRRISKDTENPIVAFQVFTCARSSCKNSFETAEELEAHNKAHDECDGKIYYCSICAISYLRKKDLTAHTKSHIIKNKIPVIDLTPDNKPFILRRVLPETEYMADTKKEMHNLAIRKSAAALEFMASAKPLTLLTMNDNQIAHSYVCKACNIIYKQRSPYLKHLLEIHNYTYGSHLATCQSKKAHQ